MKKFPHAASMRLCSKFFSTTESPFHGPSGSLSQGSRRGGPKNKGDENMTKPEIEMIARLLQAETQKIPIYQGPGLPTLRKLAEKGIAEQRERRTPFPPFGFATVKGWGLTKKFLDDNFERCSCGWFATKGQPCDNPEMSRCSTKVKYGKYNRKTKRYE